MKHTPGPWKVFTAKDLTEVQDESGLPVVSWDGFDDSRRSLKDHRANARLIAAAPDLLDICYKFIEIVESPDFEMTDTERDLLKKTRAAIAKAKGES